MPGDPARERPRRLHRRPRRARRAASSPTQLAGRAWWAALRRSVSKFRADNMTDWAAALTYYAVLALFPGLLVLVALLGLLGEYPRTTNALLDIVRQVGPQSAVDTFRGPIESVVRDKGGAGALLGVGLLGALWSASGYIGAFMRAANAIYAVKEGRPFWKLRPLQIAITVALVIVLALGAIALVLTGPLLDAIGQKVGLGHTAVTVFSVVKWPVLLVMVSTLFATLYYIAPNVRQPRFRWITPGGFVAVLVWVLASAGFAFYVAHFGSYNKTYGSLGGIVVFLLWLWISNVALLFGAEFDAELERSRELAAGEPAQRDLQLPPREAAAKS
jgi:membrane protein